MANNEGSSLSCQVQLAFKHRRLIVKASVSSSFSLLLVFFLLQSQLIDSSTTAPTAILTFLSNDVLIEVHFQPLSPNHLRATGKCHMGSRCYRNVLNFLSTSSNSEGKKRDDYFVL